MQHTQVATFEQTLRAMRDRLLNQIDSEFETIQEGINPAGNLSNVPVHLSDAASSQVDTDITVMERGHDTLEQIQHALHRLAEGNYGNCELCGREIPIERLKLIPYTPCCIDCMRKRERELATSAAPDISEVRLIGFDAIEYAAREGLTLNKSADSIDGPASNLTIAEAEAIAVDRADLIWLVVTRDEYTYRRNLTPGASDSPTSRYNKGPHNSRAGQRPDELIPGQPSSIGDANEGRNAVGTPGGGLAAGGLAGTNAGDGEVADELMIDAAMSAGIFDSSGDNIDEEEPESGSSGGAVGGRP